MFGQFPKKAVVDPVRKTRGHGDPLAVRWSEIVCSVSRIRDYM